jgi:IS30 family transposase
MVQKHNSTTHICLGSHFTWDERLRLEYFLVGKNKYPKITNKAELARIFNKNSRTITREINRGTVIHIRSEIPFEVKEYNALFAQNDANYKSESKGPGLKIERDYELLNKLKLLIVDKQYSPYAAKAYLDKKGWPTDLTLCEKTIYNYINNDYLPDITIDDLLYKGKRRKPTKGPSKHSRAYAAEHSISKRPKEVEEKTTFGHWEGDSVVGPRGNGSTSLFTCTERVTKLEIIRKTASRKQEEVVTVFDKLERASGSGKFKELIKSCTFDNGVEFSSGKGIIKSVLTKGKRFDIYYAHPYSSYERGLNENHNGIIRRFIPKGTDITSIPAKRIREIQDWMNNYPRKSLGGLTPIEKYREICGEKNNLPSYIAAKEG